MVEVKIISLSSHNRKHKVQEVFPKASFYKAVDLRTKTPENLLETKIITPSGFESLKAGRKYHHELGSAGAVGLALSFWNILKEKNGPILICEDDCIPSRLLPDVVDNLLEVSSQFDLVIFGPVMYENKNLAREFSVKNFEFLNDYFWGTHACLFTEQGRKKLTKYMEPPVDIQIDSLFSRLALYSDLKVLIQVSGVPLASQQSHTSTVQSQEPCFLCNLKPKMDTLKSYYDFYYSSGVFVPLTILFVSIVIVFFIAYMMSVNRSCPCPSARSQ
tara:strand:- start:837 stop:1658 length:822 start_codon:yes stop_codon:yes gene_type:complete